MTRITARVLAILGAALFLIVGAAAAQKGGESRTRAVISACGQSERHCRSHGGWPHQAQ